MARPREDLILFYQNADDVKKEFIIELSKPLAQKEGYTFSSSTWNISDEDWIVELDRWLIDKYPAQSNMSLPTHSTRKVISDKYKQFKAKLSQEVSNSLSNAKWARPPFLVHVDEERKLQRLKRKLGLNSNREFLQWALLQETIIDEVEGRIEKAITYRLNKVLIKATSYRNRKLKKLKEHLYELALYQATDDKDLPPEDFDEVVNQYYDKLIEDIPELSKKKTIQLIKANTSYKDVITDPALKAEDEANYGKFEWVSRDAVTLTVSRETYNELAAVIARLGPPKARE